MILDPRSVILVIVTVNVLAGAGLLAVTRGYIGQVPGASRWAWATFVQALGWFIAGTLRGVIPTTVSVVLGNFLVQLSLTLYLSVLYTFTEQKRPALRGFFMLLAAEAAALTFFTAGYPDLFARQAVISASVSAVTGASARVLWSGPQRHHASHRFMVFVFAASALALALRSVVTATWIGGGELQESTFVPTAFTSLSFLTFFVFAATLPFGFVLMCSDRYIESLRQAEEALTRMTMADTLTALPNRAMITSRLREIVASTRARPGSVSAVLFLDLDNFKYVNDSLGHEAGDTLLRETAARLTHVIQSADGVPDGCQAMAGRFGGDEFVVVLDQLRAPQLAVAVAERILAAMAEPFRLAGQPASVRCSIGITTNTGRYRDVENLLRDADAAMYRAKAAGRATYVLFDEQMLVESRRRQRLAIDLRAALGTDQIAVRFEPIIDLASGRVTAFEATAQWHHPMYGVIAAAEFATVAGETGLSVELGCLLLDEAATELDRMNRLPGGGSVAMYVNVSRRQLIDKQFRQHVASVAGRLAVGPERLSLEIGESMVARSAVIAEILTELKGHGVGLQLGDLGAGLSSIGHLRSLPIDGIKVDHRFIDAADQDVEAIAILNTIVTLGRNRGKTVIVEGISDQRQLATVLALECEGGQGELFGGAMSAAEAEATLVSDFSSYCVAA